MIKIIAMMVETVPRLLSESSAHKMLHAVWQGLEKTASLYEQRLVLPSGAGDGEGTDDSRDVAAPTKPGESGSYGMHELDGDRITIEALACEYVECVRQLVASRHCRGLVLSQLRPLAYTHIRFMQVASLLQAPRPLLPRLRSLCRPGVLHACLGSPRGARDKKWRASVGGTKMVRCRDGQVTMEQVASWSKDVNAYLAHEDMGTFETSVRISAGDLISDLCESFGLTRSLLCCASVFCLQVKTGLDLAEDLCCMCERARVGPVTAASLHQQEQMDAMPQCVL